MIAPIPSLHHVTATVADASEDLRFYSGLLGLRLVKKTVNFEHHGVYHLYYGDEVGTPSTLMTTFPYAGQGVRVGTPGAGQITVVSFSVPVGALAFWRGRFAGAGVAVSDSGDRFGAAGLMVRDPSGVNIELVEADGDDRTPWIAGGVDPAAAIRGVHGVTLLVRRGEISVRFLTKVLGLEVVARSGNRTRVATLGGGPGSWLEVLESDRAPDAVDGMGTVHHVALAVEGDEEQTAFREELARLGFNPSPVRDRRYFRSIYFREPGGILYEIATLGPGFTLDEDRASLGSALKLPPAAEANRAQVEAALPPLSPQPPPP